MLDVLMGRCGLNAFSHLIILSIGDLHVEQMGTLSMEFLCYKYVQSLSHKYVQILSTTRYKSPIILDYFPLKISQTLQLLHE